MPVTRDEVIWAFRFVLGRDPQSEDTIVAHQSARDQRALRGNLMGSAEYRGSAPNAIDFAYEIGADLDRQVTVFLHIPKCAGTTLYTILRNSISSDFCPERHNGLANWPSGALARFRLFSGHFDIASLDLIPAKKLNVVTYLREPSARLLSAYRFLRAHSSTAVVNQRHNMGLVKLAHSLDPIAFFSHPALAQHPSINNAMVRQLSGPLPQKRWEAFYPGREYQRTLTDIDPSFALSEACAQLGRMVAFGVVEYMTESVAHILSNLGIKVPSDMPRLNALDDVVQTNDFLNPVPPIEMSEELKVALFPHIELDWQLYAFALSALKTQGVVPS